MAKWVIVDEELRQYLCESNESSLDLSSDSEEEFTNEVTIDDLSDNKQTNVPSTSQHAVSWPEELLETENSWNNLESLYNFINDANLTYSNVSDTDIIFQNRYYDETNLNSKIIKVNNSGPSVVFSRWNRGNTTFNFTWPIKKVAEMEGDIILGGLMMIHERDDSQICGSIMPQGGVQALECMLYTLDWVNNQTFLPGIRLGTYILDDCDKDTYGLEQSVDFIKGSINNINDGTYRCPNGSNPLIRQKVVSGVLGAASSVTSIQVANLLRLFKIPQVSFFSTSPELSNKQRFEYFLRTVPSDTNKAQAMVEIIKQLSWTYISILYEESTYGIKAFNALEELLAQNKICIAVKEKLTKDSGVASEGVYDKIVRNLLSNQRARGVGFACKPKKFRKEDFIAEVETGLNKIKDIGEANIIIAERKELISLEKNEVQILKSLNNLDIVMCIADKGGQIVNQNKEDYTKNVEQLLNDGIYEKVKTNPLNRHHGWFQVVV
ncbi:metabotropic glutamate receptor 8-like [Limulus polyphemus]|uniref:Metabotropic glutamate receptor 8-like n=1 Tax=Limulus polyphemus TaxID=6850 RepID=A0ABM1T009_LIMPO|nr:metabotropic glutamate receptor 8-like [Limulus polyphemus]